MTSPRPTFAARSASKATLASAGAGGLFVGTSGWSYSDWVGPFYPPDLPTREWLGFYSSQFRTVELNVTFYRLPFEPMLHAWNQRAPDGFLFAVKGWRRITHVLRLDSVDEPLRVFGERIQLLGDHLGPVLWQLPPSLRYDPERLDRFAQQLPRDWRHAIEFRHTSWLCADTYDLLRRHGLALVLVSSLRMPMVTEVTAPFVYLRFHGLEGGYAHDYTLAELRPWAEFARQQLAEGHEVFAYFNNDVAAQAIVSARRFEQLVRDTGSADARSARSPSQRAVRNHSSGTRSQAGGAP